MSIASEIIRIKGLRTNIRTKLISLGLLGADSSAKLEECTEIFENMYGATQYLTTHNSYVNVANKHYAQINDPNLIATNIKNGVSIFGVTGNYSNATPTIVNDTTNNTYYYGAPGAPTDLFPSYPSNANAFQTIRFDTSSNCTLIGNNIKQGVTIMGVQGTMDYGELKGGHWGGQNYGQHASSSLTCGLSQGNKTYIVPLITLNTNEVLYATDIATHDIHVGWFTMASPTSAYNLTVPGTYAIVGIEFGRNLYYSNHPPYMVLDVIGINGFYHLLCGSDSSFEVIYATDLDDRYRAYLKIHIGDSFSYAGIHPTGGFGSMPDGMEVKFAFNTAYYHIDVRGESN